MYINQSLNKYLKDLAAKSPAPGGGSAAALAAAMAAGLVAMAAHFTCGKDKYKEFERRSRHILAQSIRTQKRLSALIDLDIKAYQAKNFKKAIDVPAEVCLLSYDIMKMAEEILKEGNRNLATDAGLAVLLAEASFVAGLSYVEANMKFLKRKSERHEQLLRKLIELLKKVRRIRTCAEVKVGYFARG